MYALFACFCYYVILVAATCPPGSGGVDCQPCGVGKYKAITGLWDCLVCPKGTVSLNVTSISLDNCQYCPVDTYEKDWSECVKCPLNTVSPVGSTGLVDCVAKAGYYGLPGVKGSLCPSGSFCSTGIMRPTPCPVNTDSSEGADKCDDAQPFRLDMWDLISLWSWGVMGFLGIVCIMGFRKTLFVIQTEATVPLIPMKIQV